MLLKIVGIDTLNNLTSKRKLDLTLRLLNKLKKKLFYVKFMLMITPFKRNEIDINK